jgi:4-amino-4-deoxy-L-arabinose transferase-like glycosyltransferase
VSLDPRRARRLAAAALGLGLALRFAYARHGFAAGYLPTSSDGYETIAQSLLHRGEYALEPGKPTSLREPSFPLYITAVYFVFGEHAGVVIFLNCVLSALTGFLLWRTGRRLFGETVALAALCVLMLHPQSIYYCAYFFRETWLCFWFAVLLWSSLEWSLPEKNPDGGRSALIGGLAAAVFGLANSAVLPACAFAGAALWLCAPPRARARRAVLYFAPLILAFGAWTARNWSVQGRFVAGSTHGGEEFYQALVVPPEDLGTPRQSEILAASTTYQDAVRLPEAEANAALMRASLGWIAEHPALYASRALAGFVKYWRPWPYRRGYQHSYALLVLASLLSDAWIIPLGFFGLWRFRARWREAPAFPSAVLAMTGVYGAVHAVIRYRLPLMAGMILLACAAAASLLAPAARARGQMK